MALPPPLEHVRKYPGMWFHPVTFETAAAFIQGFDAALSEGLLVGFREWLIVRLNGPNDLTWPPMVLMALEDPRADSTPQLLVERMFAILDEFVQARKSGGLRPIFLGYEAWLNRQSWYTPNSPQWLTPPSKTKKKARSRR